MAIYKSHHDELFQKSGRSPSFEAQYAAALDAAQTITGDFSLMQFIAERNLWEEYCKDSIQTQFNIADLI
jgi:hypothetical protein